MILKKSLSTLLFIIMTFSVSFFCFSKDQVKNKPKNIISFMGAPGAGKGTLAGKCIKELNFTSLSVGNLLREEIAKGTSLGKEVECINKGKFASDELVTAIVEAWLTENLDTIDNLILDGFPRTARQAELFLNLLHTKFNNRSFQVLNFMVSDETVVRRLADRLVCEKCQEPESRVLIKDPTKLICGMCGSNLIKREDDKEGVVRNRLKLYEKHAKSLLNVYTGAFVTIDYIDVENKTPLQLFDEFKERFMTKENIVTLPFCPVICAEQCRDGEK